MMNRFQFSLSISACAAKSRYLSNHGVHGSPTDELVAEGKYDDKVGRCSFNR
jgi:hypothetical protein